MTENKFAPSNVTNELPIDTQPFSSGNIFSSELIDLNAV